MIDIDVNEVRQLRARLREINKHPFSEIRWVENGKPVEFSAEVKEAHEEWERIGLNNDNFVTMVLDGQGSITTILISPKKPK